MNRLYILWIIICLSISLFFFNYFFPTASSQKKILAPVLSNKIYPVQTNAFVGNINKTLFIPYWGLGYTSHTVKNYDTVVYFGITANKSGIDTTEVGYKNLDQFLSMTNMHQKRLLGVRMINSEVNTKILADTTIQQAIIKQSIQIAKDKGFDGIVLDFEISAIGFDNITKEISDYEVAFAHTVKQQQLQFYATMYGDTFFRLRPFSVERIAAAVDGIMIMAYDFHKANGDPGPNFQLHDIQDDGYDLTKMIEQFASMLPPDKTTVIFGMYGYDWQVDDQKRAVKSGVALSDNTIQQKFLAKCDYQNCKILKDQRSTETEITYTDMDNANHIVWFEDMNSVAKKTEYLKSKGIGSIAYWAYSYF